MKAERRFGGIPPIVTVLITISAVVAAGLVAWFMFTTTSGATKQPMLEVTSAYVSGSGTTYTVSFVIRNVGAVQINSVSLLEITCDSGSGPVSGSSPSCSTFSSTTQTASCRATFSASISDGATCYARVSVTPSGASNPSAVMLTFKVAKP
jgi:hypothetical protein